MDSLVNLDQGCLNSFHRGPYLEKYCTRRATDQSPTSTWHDALAYCRLNYKDLAMIESAEENNQVSSLIQPYGYYTVWIGLYREPWRWSDNSLSPFTNWADGSPNNYNGAEHSTASLQTLHRSACQSPAPSFPHS
uniref:C-type lectin domain-containing protein n=1 Tax=Periophthalmus magnuspinnatus TaxID=409849 RepID=A0A3B4BGL8_9GOBI